MSDSLAQNEVLSSIPTTSNLVSYDWHKMS